MWRISEGKELRSQMDPFLALKEKEEGKQHERGLGSWRNEQHSDIW